MQNQSTSSNDTRNTPLSEYQSEVNAIVLKFKRIGLDQAHPDDKMFFGYLISSLLALGIHQFKPGEELSFADIISFLQTQTIEEESFGDITPFLQAHTVEDASFGDITPFLPLDPPQSTEMSKLELQLIMLKLESDPLFVKELETEFCRSNNGSHPLIARGTAEDSAGEYNYYNLTLTDLAAARALYSAWDTARNSTPRADNEDTVIAGMN